MGKAKKKPAASLPKDPKRNSFSLSLKKMYGLLILLVLIIYGNTVFNKYSLDDSIDIYENSNVIKGIKGIPDILSSPFVVTEYYKFDYRPVSPITFAVEKEIFGFNPHISHIINILLYILCVLLLFNVLMKITANKVPGFVLLTTVLFVVHPLHTEVVASLKNRQELLGFIFGFLSVSLLLDATVSSNLKPGKIFFSLLFFVLALLSKLASLPFAFILVYLIIFSPSKWNKLQKTGISFLFVLAPLLFLFILKMQHWLLHPVYFDENPLVEFSSLSYRTGTTLLSFLVYLKMLFFPHPLSFFYGYNTLEVIQADHPLAILSLLILLFIFAFSVRNCLLKKTSGVFGLFFLASLMMYNNIINPYTGIISARAMFMPSAWFISFIVFASREFFFSGKVKFPVINKTGIALFFLIVLASSIYVIKRNTQWKTQLSIMEADIDHLQNSTLATYWYAWSLDTELRKADSSSMYDRKYLLETSKYYYHKTISLGLKMSEPYYRLAMLSKYYDNNLDSSIFYLKTFVTGDTIHTKGYYELADSYFKKGEYAASLPYYQVVYQKNPLDTMNLYFYVLALFSTKGPGEALKLNEALMKLAPQTQYPYLGLGNILKATGNEKQAMENFEKAVQLGCTNTLLIQDMIKYYKIQKDTVKEIQYQKYLDAL